MLIFHLSLIVPMLVALNKIKSVTIGFSFRKYVHSREIGDIKKRYQRPGRYDT